MSSRPESTTTATMSIGLFGLKFYFVLGPSLDHVVARLLISSVGFLWPTHSSHMRATVSSDFDWTRLSSSSSAWALWLIRIFKSLASRFFSVFFYGHVCDKTKETRRLKTPTETETETEVEAGKLPISTMSLKWLNFNFDKGLAKKRKKRRRKPAAQLRKCWCLNNDVITVGINWPSNCRLRTLDSRLDWTGLYGHRNF